MNVITSRLADQPEELWLLVGRFCDGLADATECHRLEQHLRASDMARDLLVAYLGVHAELQWRHRGATAADFKRPQQSVVIPDRETADEFTELLHDAKHSATNDLLKKHVAKNTGNSSITRRMTAPVLGWIGNAFPVSIGSRLLLVIVLCGACFTGFWLWESRPIIESTVAYLTASHDCQWTDAAPQSGSKLVRGPLQLRSGVAKLEFTDGTRLVVEGPSDFELRSSGSMYLRRGVLLAHVPRQAVGFSVETPTATIVDRGTDFIVNVSTEGNTQLAVTQGAVDLLPFDSHEGSQRVVAHQAREIVKHGSDRVVAKLAPFDASWIAHAKQIGDSFTPKLVGTVAFQVVPERVTGNQGDDHTGLGIDFEVKSPIRITSLGVFDHLGDGFAANANLTVQIWSRNTHGTPASNDDDGIDVLAAVTFSGADAGQWIGSFRYKPLADAVELAPGAYTVVAFGFTERDPNLNFSRETTAILQVETSGAALSPVIASRFQNPNQKPDERGPFACFPQSLAPRVVNYAAGSFQYVLVE